MPNVFHSKPSMTYSNWIQALKIDPDIRPGVLEAIPEAILVEWWEQGLAPSRRAIADAVAVAKNPTTNLDSVA